MRMITPCLLKTIIIIIIIFIITIIRIDLKYFLHKSKYVMTARIL